MDMVQQQDCDLLPAICHSNIGIHSVLIPREREREREKISCQWQLKQQYLAFGCIWLQIPTSPPAHDNSEGCHSRVRISYSRSQGTLPQTELPCTHRTCCQWDSHHRFRPLAAWHEPSGHTQGTTLATTRKPLDFDDNKPLRIEKGGKSSDRLQISCCEHKQRAARHQTTSSS